jgi:2-polyprenyl-3-methyl-5-hydroxy-6-metoxy-1,4-benzoquinol methylase
VVLCDCDLYFVRSLEAKRIQAPAAGRVVDRPNPPYSLLQSLFEAQGLATPLATDVGFPMADSERTVASNWNGGLYVFDVGQMEAWGRVWAATAMRLLADIDSLGPYRNHVDQISWALTINHLSIPFEHLPDVQNYPVHFSACDLYRRAPPDIASFHYHHCMDALGRIRLTGISELDAQIEVANRRNTEILLARLIRNDTLFLLFQRWQSCCAPASPDGLSAAVTAFQNPRYGRHNARRLEHLASLNLDIRGRSVLEFGAGVGDHSLFFLDRDCHVTSIEPRAENVTYILHRHATEGTAFPEERHRVIRCGVEESETFLAGAKFQIVYNYGLLYHLGEPEAFLRQSAVYCEGLYLLETAVRDLIDVETAYVEDTAELTNSISGTCNLLSRQEIFDILQECLPFIYMPVTQPAHEQFLREWSVAPRSRLGRHRAVFVGSVTRLDSALLSDRVLDRHGG